MSAVARRLLKYTSTYTTHWHLPTCKSTSCCAAADGFELLKVLMVERSYGCVITKRKNDKDCMMLIPLSVYLDVGIVHNLLVKILVQKSNLGNEILSNRGVVKRRDVYKVLALTYWPQSSLDAKVLSRYFLTSAAMNKYSTIWVKMASIFQSIRNNQRNVSMSLSLGGILQFLLITSRIRCDWERRTQC